jgi:hypothetical protein
MYRVTRRELEITVIGPDQFETKIDSHAVGIVVRRCPEWPYDQTLPYAIQCSQMTDPELVAYALGLESYPE